MERATICYKTPEADIGPHHRTMNRIEEEVGAVDDLGDRNREALPLEDDRREPTSNALPA